MHMKFLGTVATWQLFVVCHLYFNLNVLCLSNEACV